MTTLPLLALLPTLHAEAACPATDPWIQAIDAGSPCLTVALDRAWRVARDHGETECLLRALDARDLPGFDPAVLGTAPVPPPLPEKALHDTYHAPYSLESDNFVIFWGSRAGDVTDDAQSLLDSFETAWTLYSETMGMPFPTTTDAYKFSVYIGDSGSGLPSAYGAGGYSTYDRDGYPIIVIAMDYLSDHAWTSTSSVHELFHAFQGATGAFVNYTDGDPGAWYWEATATWAEGQVYPDNDYNGCFLFGFAYLPYLEVNYFNYPDRGTLDEYHQYGAFIFPQYVSEHHDWHVVVDVWLEGGATGDPLATMDDLLADRGTDVPTTWKDFVAHNVTWDYRDGDLYKYYLYAYSSYYEDKQIAARYTGNGPTSLADPSWDLPHRLGANVIALQTPDDGYLHVEFEGDSTGTSGHSAQWLATVVAVKGAVPTYVDVPIDTTTGSLVLPDAGSWDALYLVVGPTSDTIKWNEDFGYRFAFYVSDEGGPVDTGDPPTPDTGDPDTAGSDTDTATWDTGDGKPHPLGKTCACTTGATRGGWTLLVLTALVPLARRSRRRP